MRESRAVLGFVLGCTLVAAATGYVAWYLTGSLAALYVVTALAVVPGFVVGLPILNARVASATTATGSQPPMRVRVGLVVTALVLIPVAGESGAFGRDLGRPLTGAALGVALLAVVLRWRRGRAARSCDVRAVGTHPSAQEPRI
jgi:hypothetical protein